MDRRCAIAIVLFLVGGCSAARETSDVPTDAHPAALPTSTITSDQRVVAYPQGRWLLYGDGSAGAPYTWVWVPTGTVPPPPAPPTR